MRSPSGLLTNDEVLAVNQDPLGKQATHVKDDSASRRRYSGPTVGRWHGGRRIVQPRPLRNRGPGAPRAGQTPPPQVWKLTDRSTKQATEFASEAEAKTALAKVADPVDATVEWSDLHLAGPQTVRDLWRQKDLGKSDGHYTASVPFHGAVMLKIGTPKADE